jgi:hypothetical protein
MKPLANTVHVPKKQPALASSTAPEIAPAGAHGGVAGNIGAVEGGVVVGEQKFVDGKREKKRSHVVGGGAVAEVGGAASSSGIDAVVGKHLKKALGGKTLAGAAANDKQLRKMTESLAVIATVEKLPGRLGSITGFKPSDAFKLYEHCFPNPDEREPIGDIKDRLKHYDGGAEKDGGNFHALSFADKEGHVVAYSQGSTVPSKQGLFYYWQYGCVADGDYMKERYGSKSNPREHGVLNTIHGVNAATLEATAEATKQPAIGMMWESEPRGLGDDKSSIQFTDKRLAIHNRAGGRVMMGMTKEGELVNLHLQPRLTADSEPIALHVMFRPLKYAEGDEQKRGAMEKSSAEAMMMGWVDNFRREGFAEKDVAEAEAEIRGRFARCESIVLLPANEVPDAVTLAKSDPILAKQILDMYGVGDLDAARAFYEKAMAG